MFSFIHSIRFRVWFLFIGFTILIMISLYINQILLLPSFYDYMKTKETVSTADVLKKNWGKNDFIETVISLSKEQYMRIQVDVIDSETGDIVSSITQEPMGAFSFVYKPTNTNDEIYKEVQDSPRGIITEKHTSNEEHAYLFLVAIIGTKDNIQGYITIHNFIEPLGNTGTILRSQFYVNAAVLLTVAFALSAFVVMKISNPIIRISYSAKKLATGDFNMKVTPGSYAEIKELIENLNKASSEISKTERLRKDLIANVSHDLKTPLTMIKAYAEMIRDLSGDNPEKREKHLQVIIEEADRLNSLVVDLLDLSRIQSGIAEKKSVPFDFSEHLKGVMNRFLYLSETEKYNITTDLEENIVIKADMAKLEQAVYNLVINAVNYTGDDGKVLVRLYKKTPVIGRFEVIDNGKGIPPEELPYIWERYYKVNKSEFYKRTDVGTGLGLSIVKGVLEIHGYKYGVESKTDEGSTFWFEFPLHR